MIGDYSGDDLQSAVICLTPTQAAYLMALRIPKGTTQRLETEPVRGRLLDAVVNELSGSSGSVHEAIQNLFEQMARED